MEYRIEHDSMGEVQGSRRQILGRADRSAAMRTSKSAWASKPCPREITHAFGILKKAAAHGQPRAQAGKDDRRKARLPLSKACDEVISGQLERATSRWSSGRPAAARSPT